MNQRSRSTLSHTQTNRCQSLNINYKRQILSLNHRDPSISFSLIYVITFLLERTWQNKTLESNYALFHIPYSFLCAFLLSLFLDNQQATFTSAMLRFSIKKMNRISNCSSSKQERKMLQTAIIQCLTYHCHRNDSGYYMRLLKQFVQEHQA